MTAIKMKKQQQWTKWEPIKIIQAVAVGKTKVDGVRKKIQDEKNRKHHKYSLSVWNVWQTAHAI